MITIEGLSKTYAGTGRPALNDIALQIPKGAIYGILGRSGAGKSTLIRCLNLLERPTSGRILVNGQDITQLNKAALRDYRLRTGMIFQHFNLLHARTVADNIAVPLEIAGVPRAAREARVRELLVTPWSRLRQSLLHDPQAEQDFLTRHGVQGRPLCGVA